jgi:nitroreductase
MNKEIQEQELMQILEVARWAPSGDNHQPWRFRLLDSRQIEILGHDTRDEVLYDLDGHASHIALGTLLETIHIAATQKQWQCRVDKQGDETAPRYILSFEPQADIERSELFPYIEQRRVQRRALSRHKLTAEHKQALAKVLDSGYRIHWLEGYKRRWQMARLMYTNAGLRLSIPEAYPVHCRAIQWHSRFSIDRIPDTALGTDPLTTRAMQWAMHSWRRLRFMNRYLAGSVLPRIEMDLLPSFFCGAHFVLIAPHPARTMDDYVDAGANLQRVWLKATQLGLQLQPEHTPLVFHQYVIQGRPFSSELDMFIKAQGISARLNDIIGIEQLQHAVFMGRIGYGRAAEARSLRLEVNELLS